MASSYLSLDELNPISDKVFGNTININLTQREKVYGGHASRMPIIWPRRIHQRKSDDSQSSGRQRRFHRKIDEDAVSFKKRILLGGSE
jgi:hypothetical protein